MLDKLIEIILPESISGLELLVLGAAIPLRALLSILIHFETKEAHP